MITTITWYEHPILSCAALMIISFSLTTLLIPPLLHIAKTKKLYDEPKQPLKIHHHPVPRLGGAAIFISFVITLLLFAYHSPLLAVNHLLVACTMIFALGIKDDLCGVAAPAKFFITFIAVLLLVIPGQIRLDNLYGLFGIYELPPLSSTMLSVMILIFITHAFNLIDGIDGLAAATGIMVMLVFTALFINMAQYELASTSISMMGALLGFLKFNLTPAKLFMGDTGSLLIGLVSAVMGLKLIAISATPLNISPLLPPQRSMIIVAVVFLIPICDTIRVCFIRMMNGKSPFQGDKNHIHHRLLQLGFSHLQTTGILIVINGLMIGLVLFFLV